MRKLLVAVMAVMMTSPAFAAIQERESQRGYHNHIRRSQ